MTGTKGGHSDPERGSRKRLPVVDHNCERAPSLLAKHLCLVPLPLKSLLFTPHGARLPKSRLHERDVLPRRLPDVKGDWMY